MIHPRFWIKHARARSALRGYPLYDVPHKRAEGTMSEAEAQENFDYFMRVRLTRLEFFTTWLRVNFSVAATLDGDGLQAVSRWADDYGGGLIGDETRTLTIYATYQPRWEGKFAGYNVMIDLGIYLGEYLIAKRPKLYWEIYRGHEVEPETFKSVGYMRPCLGGMPRLWKPSPLSHGYGAIASARALATMPNRHMSSESSLVRSAREVLYLSNLPDGSDPIIIGDSRNEPI